MKVKVCGMTQADNIRQVEALGVDMMGFIFYAKSPRCLRQMPAYMPIHAQRVGVFVNERIENIAICAERYGLDYIQLHGDESPEQCHDLRLQGLELIKAFPMATADDLCAVEAYEGLCRYYLFDTKTPQRGGSGSSFDWNLLQQYQGTTPFLLSGGIHPNSYHELNAFHHPQWAGIDLNSRFETAPGVKDPESISTLMEHLKI